MKRHPLTLIGVLIVSLVTASAQRLHAADDPKAQIDFLQSVVQELQTQRNQALDAFAVTKAQAAAQIAALQKRIDALEDSAKKPPEKKP